ncbi:hypothetical protein HBH50_144240 [Parastagonospora nodorum]|nr:hypothetical protein HBH50_144240 [Parastagonospora nodorum]KAH4086062.1 hypothetical protein HBH48_145630 [Parastagonospora nodorum]
MMRSALPYNFRWTAKLLRRDIHNFKAKAISKIKTHLTRLSKSAAEAIDISMVSSVARASIDPEDPPSIKSTASTTADVVGTSNILPLSSVSTSAQHPNTLHELLESQLNTLWSLRDHNMSEKERWQFRGSWLVLWNAIQACSSNPGYDIFDGLKKDETALLLQLIELCAAKASKNAQRVSRMPATPYMAKRDHVRFDSVFSKAASSGGGAPMPTTSQLWHSILEGATDDTKTDGVAEALLAFIWPEQNPVEILDAIGDPAKVFRGGDELRLRLRDLLFPSYTTISAPRM